MTERFSKQKLIGHLMSTAEKIEKLHNLNRWHGTEQLRAGDVNRAVAYGEMNAILELVSEIQEKRI